MLDHSERSVNVSGFDEAMVKSDLKIGTGVAAYDLPDGTTILVVVNEGIDHTTQPHTMLSTNQMRQHGVDVCDVHPKFTSGGQKGKFRIKVGDYELPFKMVNGIAALTFRLPTFEEMEKCDVVRLTASAVWDPEDLTGNSFTPGSDPHFYERAGRTITKAVTFIDGETFFDCDDTDETFFDCEDTAPVTEPSVVPVPHGSEDISTNWNDIEVTVVKTATTDIPPVPDLAKPEHEPHIIESNGEFGESQDLLYDNIDQYAAFHLDVEGPSLDLEHVFELDQWVKDTNRRAVNRMTVKESDINWNDWQRCLGWFPIPVCKKTHAAT